MMRRESRLIIKTVGKRMEEEKNLKEVIEDLRLCETSSDMESKEALSILLQQLKQMPVSNYRLLGSYALSKSEMEEYSLFYLPDMALFRRLIRLKRYQAAVHEICDFLEFKVLMHLHNNNQCLPANLKDALIYVIETELGV